MVSVLLPQTSPQHFPEKLQQLLSPKEPQYISSTTILQFRDDFLHYLQNSSLNFSSFMMQHFITHWTKSFKYHDSSLAFIAQLLGKDIFAC